MKRFELTLIVRDKNDKDELVTQSINQIEHDDFVGLITQFILIVAIVQRECFAKEITHLLRGRPDDDIPF